MVMVIPSVYTVCTVAWPVADVPLLDLAELSKNDTPTLSLSTDSLWDQVGTRVQHVDGV